MTEYASCWFPQRLRPTARCRVRIQTRVTPSADWKHRTSRAHQLRLRQEWPSSDQPGAGRTLLDQVYSRATRGRRWTTASKRRFGSDYRSADENTHWGSYVFSLSLFLPRTGLTARKTSQHHLHVGWTGLYQSVTPTIITKRGLVSARTRRRSQEQASRIFPTEAWSEQW